MKLIQIDNRIINLALIFEAIFTAATDSKGAKLEIRFAFPSIKVPVIRVGDYSGGSMSEPHSLTLWESDADRVWHALQNLSEEFSQ
jgi:hypothetical protein